jgi:hypothetical protein
MPSISVPAAIIGAGAVGGAATLASGAIASGAASKAAAQNNALETSIYNQNSANEQPYIQSGDTANTALQGFLGLDGSDTAASTKALNSYLNSTGYQFNLDQGLNAVESSKAASGLLGSGSTLQALDKFATGEADQYGQQYEQNLQGVVNTGASAASALAGQGQNFANGVSSNNNSAASATGNAALSGANSVNALLGTALKANAFATGGTSFGGSAGTGSNAFVTGSGDLIGG